MNKVRIATWNIWHDKHEIETRTLKIAEILKKENCDAVLIQENTELYGTTTARIIADETGMTATERIDQRGYGVAVLTKTRPLATWEPEIAEDRYESHGRYVAVTTEINRKRCYIGSAHLAWGSRAEPLRLAEITRINQHAQQHAEEITVIGGDFNAVPESSTVRHINGLDGPDLWIDCWKTAGEGEGHTSVGDNRYAAVTAGKRGNMHPLMLPKRRIDYIFVREWMYGKTGCPTEAHLLGVLPNEHSDHYGVSVELLELLDPDSVSV